MDVWFLSVLFLDELMLAPEVSYVGDIDECSLNSPDASCWRRRGIRTFDHVYSSLIGLTFRDIYLLWLMC